jgi:sugar phosphate isomerase/epimerase
MFKCLVPGCLGIKLPWEEWPALAASTGFDAVDVHPLDPSRGAAFYHDALEARGIRAGGTPLPVEFRKGQREFDESLAGLEAKAKLAAEIGLSRFYTWILPASDDLPFDENYRLHAGRLGECAGVLRSFACRLGLEFVGPKTSRDGKKHAFIHTMRGMLELCADVGPNAGLLLDSWHLYASHGRAEEVRKLEDEHIVYVHVNDAPEGIAVDRQQDLVRRLPGATGVEDIQGFMDALRHIGYSGPVTPEPFDETLHELSPEAAARKAAEAMTKIWG